MNNRVQPFSIENARIGFRNFVGAEGQFNPKGQRNFCVFIDTPLAETLERDGWNVRWLEPRDEAEGRQAYLPVKVSFDNVPPKIMLITSRNKTLLEEEDVKMLDYAEISNVDLIINPYVWEIKGKGNTPDKSGIKAYVKSMYVTLVEDEFESKYYEVPDSAINTIKGADAN